MNTSFVPLNYQLEMSSDGDYPAVSASEQNADFVLHSRPDTRKPQEFTITPNHGLVPAQSSTKIKVWKMIGRKTENYELLLELKLST